MELDDIQIQIGSPQQRSEIGGVNKYFVYALKGKDNKGEIAIVRRYSDFNLLREILVKRWPGCYIPSLPEKKTIGSSESVFVESRRRGLQIFLQTLAHSLPIWNSQEMQIFLRNSTVDTQKMLTSLLKQTLDKILTRYIEAFSDLNTGEIMQDASANISQFSSYLKDSKVFLEKLIEQTQKMHQIYNNNLQKKLAVLQFLLPDYEKNCLHYNDQKKNIDLLFMESERFEIKDSIENYKKINEYPPILFVTEEIRRQKRQIDAFEEAIRTNNQIEGLKLKATGKVKDLQLKQSKINAGKQSIFSMIKSKSKDSQLSENKQQTELAKSEQASYNKLCQIITNMIGTKEIYRFKQLRQKAYYKMLKSFATMEKQLARSEGDIWLATQNHDWVGENEQKKEVEQEQEQEQETTQQESLREVVKKEQQNKQQEHQQLHEQVEEEIKQQDL